MRALVGYTIMARAKGDPGLLSGIGKVFKGVAKVATSVLPGPIGAVARTAVGVLTGGGSRPTAVPGGMPTLAAVQGPGARPVPGITGAAQRLIPGGRTGYFKSRRMNPGNAKAARRAIRRIKSVRKLLQSIERQMPKRSCACKAKRGR